MRDIGIDGFELQRSIFSPEDGKLFHEGVMSAADHSWQDENVPGIIHAARIGQFRPDTGPDWFEGQLQYHLKWGVEAKRPFASIPDQLLNHSVINAIVDANWRAFQKIGGPDIARRYVIGVTLFIYQYQVKMGDGATIPHPNHAHSDLHDSYDKGLVTISQSYTEQIRVPSLRIFDKRDQKPQFLAEMTLRDGDILAINETDHRQRLMHEVDSMRWEPLNAGETGSDKGYRTMVFMDFHVEPHRLFSLTPRIETTEATEEAEVDRL